MLCEEFLKRIVEALGITVNRCPKGRPRKMERLTIEKIECVVAIFHSITLLENQGVTFEIGSPL